MNTSTFVLIIVIVLAVGGFALQYLKGIGKSFQNPSNSSSEQSLSIQQQQKLQSQEIEEQRRAYMESIKQRIQDSKRY